MNKLNIDMIRNFYDYIIDDVMTFVNMFEPNYDVPETPDGKYKIRLNYKKIFIKSGVYDIQKILHFYDDITDIASFTVADASSVYINFEENVLINDGISNKNIYEISILTLLGNINIQTEQNILKLPDSPDISAEGGKAVKINDSGFSFENITFTVNLDTTATFPTIDPSYVPTTLALKNYIDSFYPFNFDYTFQEVTDLNSITASGIYKIGTLTNAPNIYETFFGLICINQNGKILQIIYSENGNKYTRTYINNIWFSWKNKLNEKINKRRKQEITEYKKFAGDQVIKTWYQHQSGNDSNEWRSVCWSPELSMFVSVADSGINRVQYSYDGINWTAVPSGNDSNFWYSVCWSPELAMFVSVAYAGTNRVQYSYDGINWTAVTSGNDSNNWFSVCWSSELSMFISVACSGTNRVMYSYDGINWTAVTSGNESNGWISVCWSPELSMFISVASSGINRVMYSYDGINWTTTPSGNEANGWVSICWSPELAMFVSVAYTYGGTTNRVQYSYDGINWTATPSGNDSNGWVSICWSPELAMFVSVANSGTNSVQYSYDGINWTATPSGNEANGWFSVCWSPELSIFVAVALDGTNRVMTSRKISSIIG